MGHSLDPLLQHPSPWLGGEGPHADLVLSTRIRLARNLQSVPFTHRAREEQLHGVLVSVADVRAFGLLLHRPVRVGTVGADALGDDGVRRHAARDRQRPLLVLLVEMLA